ncbi:MAG: hypothetical protein ACYTDY_09815 [Planctomycetota bacterium]|jgi:hypothetical protein
MARRAPPPPREGPPADEYEGTSRVTRRFERRRKDNTPLYIAVGAAVVVGIVLIIVFTGSSPEGENVDAARFALRELLRTCIENDAAAGVTLVDPKFVLQDENPDLLKQWRELPVQRRKDLTDQAFRWIQMKVQNDLKLQSMQEVEVLLAAANSKYQPSARRVDLWWSYAGKTWNAALSNYTGKWLLLRLGKARGR